MNETIPKLILCAWVASYGIAYAAEGKITITSPADGAAVSAKSKVKVSYEAEAGPEGDHLHLNVDGKRMDVLRQLKGSAEVDALSPGKHQICLLLNTRAHVPVGVEKCVSVIAK